MKTAPAAECENVMDDQSNKKKTTSKQIVALVGVALLVILYIATLVIAIVDNTESGRWFMLCIFATVIVPLLIWVYTWLYGKYTGRHTIADAEHSLISDILACADDTADRSGEADNNQ